MMAKEMMKALLEENSVERYTDSNDDVDFSKVLEFYGEPTYKQRKLRCSDGTERTFSFDN